MEMVQNKGGTYTYLLFYDHLPKFLMEAPVHYVGEAMHFSINRLTFITPGSVAMDRLLPVGLGERGHGE